MTQFFTSDAFIAHPKRIAASIALVASSLIYSASASADSSMPSAAVTANEATGGAGATAPTKILAIGRLTAKATGGTLKPVLPQEVRDTVKLYLAGKIDQWYFKPDDAGVVFVLNVTDVKQAHDLLRQLPLGRAGLMEFELIRLAPLQPLGMLINPSVAEQQGGRAQ
jgi:hypothetical protein